MIGLSSGISTLWLVLAEEGGPGGLGNGMIGLNYGISALWLVCQSGQGGRKGEGEGLGNGMTGLPENWW